LFQLNPVLSAQGLLLVGGRLSAHHSTLQTMPIILPADCTYTDLLIRRAHERIHHFSIIDTLVEMRRTNWILRGRQAVRRMITRCTVCKRYSGKPLSQPTGDLPFDRVNREPSFRVIGLDTAGPLRVSDVDAKLYILVITCATVRAVHFEVIQGLNLENFINGLRRFMAEKGIPDTIYSDNYSTLKKTARELHSFNKMIRSEKTKEFIASKKINWKFIPDYASWQAGFYERIIGTMKSALRKSLGRSTLKLDQLITVIKEIQHTINQRPLCAVNDDPDDFGVITPNHFLFPEYEITGEDLKTDKSGSDLVKLWRSQRTHVENCWSAWFKLYMGQLRSFYYTLPKNKSRINVGDLVIVMEKWKPKFQWKLARVAKVDDEETPSVCELRVAGAKRLQIRAIQHLIHLEADPSTRKEDS
jgi:hypothetical protein